MIQDIDYLTIFPVTRSGYDKGQDFGNDKVAKTSKWTKRSLLVVAIAGALLVMSPVRAAMPPGMEVFDNATEISDADLGHMRGKFVAAGQVMYFGVEMVTQWLTASGQLISASGNLQVNVAGSTPQVSFKPSITVDQGAPTNQTAIQGVSTASGGGGLQNVNGVVQSIQVAGAANGVANSIGMNVRVSSALPDNQLQSGPLSASIITPNGSLASVSLGAGGMQVSVAVPDQGQAIQQIRNAGGSVGGQVLQSVQLGGNLNQIHNMIQLNVQMSNLGSNLASRSGDMLQAMQLMPPHPTF